MSPTGCCPAPTPGVLSPSVSIGRVVHFVVPNGEHRPAMVVNGPRDERPGGYSQACNLRVFLDGCNDAQAVQEDEDVRAHGGQELP